MIRVILLLVPLTGCATGPFVWPSDYISAAKVYCLRGELAACTTYVGGGYGPTLP